MGVDDIIYRCFACDRKLGKSPKVLVDTRDGQRVFVGTECNKRIIAAGEAGYQPPTGGPRLWCLSPEDAAKIAADPLYFTRPRT